MYKVIPMVLQMMPNIILMNTSSTGTPASDSSVDESYSSSLELSKSSDDSELTISGPARASGYFGTILTTSAYPFSTLSTYSSIFDLSP